MCSQKYVTEVYFGLCEKSILLSDTCHKSRLSSSIVKNNGKEGLEFSKVRREKWLPQIFRKDLTERTRKKKNENNAFCLPFTGFFTEIHNIRFAKQIRILS